MSRLPAHSLRAKGFIFDLDGTLIDSTPIVEKHWREFALEHDLDPEKILVTSKGRRMIETIAEWVPHKATLEVAEEYERKLAENTDGLSVLPGATALLEKIPKGHVAICTGDNKTLAKTRLDQCKIPVPEILSTGDSIVRGKPDPECYLAAAKGLGLDPSDCVVFDNSPLGIQAANAAGMSTIACTTTHTTKELKAANATFVISFLSDVDVVVLPDGDFNVVLTSTL